MNISKEHNAFVWLPSKTGSCSAARILNFYNFKTYINDNEVELRPIHLMEYFPGHENYTFICTARNPFTRFLSQYKFNHKDPNQWSVEGFRQYFDHDIRFFLPQKLYPFKERTPDYFIKLENLKEDYGKIPFIRESEYFLSGQLHKQCEIKINSTEEIQNPQDYYSNEMIDKILDVGKDYFELLNYDYPF